MGANIASIYTHFNTAKNTYDVIFCHPTDNRCKADKLAKTIYDIFGRPAAPLKYQTDIAPHSG